MTNTNNPVELKNVSKSFSHITGKELTFKGKVLSLFRKEREIKKRFWALRNVGFSIEKGETLGIIGANGSGKSTLLKLIAGIHKPDEGVVKITGRVSSLIELGAGFHPDLTGRENIFLNGSLLGFSRKEIKLKYNDIVEFSELAEFIHTPVKYYSSGMYMRLAFSIAVNVEPEILLVDEVLAVGDESFQRRCLDKINEFKSRGVTIVFVSHSLDAVKAVCSRVVWLEKGQVELNDTAEKAVNFYISKVQAKEENTAPAKPRPRQVSENRWGTQEAEITGVKLYGADLRERYAFASGEGIRIEISYSSKKSIANPVFGVGIHRIDGVHISGVNTLSDNIRIEKIEGAGRVIYTIKSAPLLEGTYKIIVALHDEADRTMYDYHDRIYEFKITKENNRNRSGLVRFDDEWKIN